MAMETWKKCNEKQNNHIDTLLHLYIMAARWRYNTINDSASSDSSVHQTLMSLLIPTRCIHPNCKMINSVKFVKSIHGVIYNFRTIISIVLTL